MSNILDKVNVALAYFFREWTPSVLIAFAVFELFNGNQIQGDIFFVGAMVAAMVKYKK